MTWARSSKQIKHQFTRFLTILFLMKMVFNEKKG